MSLLLETTLGDLVIDLDVEGSPELCKNVLKLAKARYYTSTLIYNIQANRFAQFGDPRGDGSGGACIYGLLDSDTSGNNKIRDVTQSKRRFLKSSMGRALTPSECREPGRVVATEMNGISDTIGSQLLITIDEGQDKALDGFQSRPLEQNNPSNSSGNNSLQAFRSIGQVVEDDDQVLDQIAKTYCDADGRPYADIRIIRALVIDDPFEDPPGMKQLLKQRDVTFDQKGDDDDDNSCKVVASPDYERPPEETVEIRIQADQIDTEAGEEDVEKVRQQEEELLQREDKSRAVVLEMLGDLPSADIKAPENVLFVCKLNPVTEDEDLELIFSRFDEKVKAEIIRDHESGSSLQYAFVEFTTKAQAAEAYFKLNNALVDDRRIKVDFSQSVAKVWDRFNQRERGGGKKNSSHRNMPRDPFHGNHDGNRHHSRKQHHQGMRHTQQHKEHHRRDDRHHQRPRDRDAQHRHGGDRRQDRYHPRHDSRHARDDRDNRHDRHRDEYDRYHLKDYGQHRRGGSNSHGGAEKDEFGRSVERTRSPSPRDRRNHHRGYSSESPSSRGDDSRGHERRHGRRDRRSRSRSRERRREKKHKKHKRQHDRHDESRERRQKKHRRERSDRKGEKKHRHSRHDDSSEGSRY